MTHQQKSTDVLYTLKNTGLFKNNYNFSRILPLGTEKFDQLIVASGGISIA